MFVVSSASFGDVNVATALGGMIHDDMTFVFFGIIGSVVGAFLGWAVKDNVLD